MAFTACDQNDGHGIIQNITKSIGWSTVAHPRATPVNDGSTWHRATYEADTVAKYMRIWLDGIFVLDSTGYTPNMPVQGFKNFEVGKNNPAVIVATTILYSDFVAFSRP